MSSAIVLALLVAAARAPTVSLDTAEMQAESRRALANYVGCLVERNGPAVEAHLRLPYDDRASKASRGLHDLACPFATRATQFRAEILRDFDGLGFRAALYQALLARDLSRINSAVILADPGAAAFPAGRMWPGSPAANYLQYIGMGRCLISRDALSSRQLIQSEVESPQELAATRALSPILSKCGWRKSDVGLIRGALAEIAYRASFASAPAHVTSTADKVQ